MKKKVMQIFVLMLVASLLLIVGIYFGNFIGFAIFSDSVEGDFDLGSYTNTSYNGSAVVLVGGNLSGSYTSQVFDAGAKTNWNNLSWQGGEPSAESLWGVDGGGDVYSSADGITWNLKKEDFGRTTDTADMFSDSSYFYIISSSNKEVWRSGDGVSWTVVNDSFTVDGLREGVADGNDVLYIATGPGNVYSSTDSGITWTEQGDLNGGKTEDPKGLDVNSSNDIFAVDGKGRVEVSIDGGVIWTEMTGAYGGGSETDALQVDILGNVYILNNKQVYKSTDNGATWNIINDSFTSYDNNGCRMLIDSLDNFFILDCVGRTFKSTDSGVSWIELGDMNAGASNDPKGLTSFVLESNLSFQVKNCSSSDCSDGVWQTKTLGAINLVGRYFQYRVNFIGVDSTSPYLESVDVDYTLPPEEVYVNDDFNSGTEGWGVTHFKNITSAFNAIQEGGKINVASGNYNERLILSKSVNLLGEGSGTTTINGGGTGNVVTISTNYMNISGFNITGSGTSWGNSGIYLNSVENCVIENNSISGNRVGLSLISAYSNTIKTNYIISSTEYGIYTNNWATQNNYIYNNYFDNSNNFYAASQPPNLAYFNITKAEGTNIVGGQYIGGNFWNSYSGSNRGDGFGDVTYNVQGSYYDYLPLVDNSIPTISLVSPQEGASYGYNESIALNYSVNDADGDIDSCWYNLDDSENVSLVNCANTTFDVSGDGSYILNIYVNDSEGEEVNDSAGFNVQVGAPSISLSSPIGVYLASGENIEFIYTATDIDLDSCELWGNFVGEWARNQTNTEVVSGIVDSFSLNLSDGIYIWNIKCNDSLGNVAINGNQTFYVDTTNPSVSLTQPSGTKTVRTGIGIIFSALDDNLGRCWFNVYRGESVEVANTSLNCSSGSGSFDVTVDADFVLNLWVNDSAGNLNRTNSSFSVDTSSSPPANPPSSGGGGSSGGGSSFFLNGTSKLNLEFSGLSDLLLKKGTGESIELFVVNKERRFLNNCKLSFGGEGGNWLSNNQAKGFSSGEKFSYGLELNVPNDVEPGVYNSEVVVQCDEGSASDSFLISVYRNNYEIEILDYEREGNALKVFYSLQEYAQLNHEIVISYSIVDFDGIERIKGSEAVSLGAGEFVEDVLEFDLPKDSFGEFELVLELDDGLSNISSNQTIFLPSVGLTGLVVQDIVRNTRSLIFAVVFFGLVLFFAVRFIWKHHKRVGKKIGGGRKFLEIEL